MAGPQNWTEELIAQRVKNGRGMGTGRGYSPWILVQEFSSKGTQTRVPGVKLNRTVHTFSYLERSLFLFTEFQSNFVDYQEQFPMDRSITLGAAKALVIKHPRYPRSRIPLVMTLDAVATRRNDAGQECVAAWDVKTASQLKKPRVAEKLSLHKAYCAHRGIPHYLFTENSVSRNVVRNIDWMRMSVPKDGELATVPGIFTWHPDQMLEQLANRRKASSITNFCAEYDFANKLEFGSGLRILKTLLWSHRVEVNLDVKWIEREPVPRPAQGWKSSLQRRVA